MSVKHPQYAAVFINVDGGSEKPTRYYAGMEFMADGRASQVNVSEMDAHPGHSFVLYFPPQALVLHGHERIIKTAIGQAIRDNLFEKGGMHREYPLDFTAPAYTGKLDWL